MSDEPIPTWQNEAIKEARAIGEQLKAQHDIQPSSFFL